MFYWWFFTEPKKSIIYDANVDAADEQIGNNAKRMIFKLNGLDNVKLSQNARLCIESLNIPILYDNTNNPKTFGLHMIKMSNISSINCYDSHGNGQSDPVIFTAQPHITQQKVYDAANDVTTSSVNMAASQVFYNPNPKIMYNFPISSNFFNHRQIDSTLIFQFINQNLYDITTDQLIMDNFHISLLYMI